MFPSNYTPTWDDSSVIINLVSSTEAQLHLRNYLPPSPLVVLLVSSAAVPAGVDISGKWPGGSEASGAPS